MEWATGIRERRVLRSDSEQIPTLKAPSSGAVMIFPHWDDFYFFSDSSWEHWTSMRSISDSVSVMSAC